MLSAGDCFTGTFPPGSSKLRRFIVLTDEVGGECTVAWTYASTLMSDMSCVLTPVDHPMFTKTCVVVYEEAIIADANTIRTAVANGALKPESRLNPRVLKRAFDALFASDLTPEGVLDYCADR